MNKTDKLNKH